MNTHRSSFLFVDTKQLTCLEKPPLAGTGRLLVPRSSTPVGQAFDVMEYTARTRQSVRVVDRDWWMNMEELWSIEAIPPREGDEI